ncbi:MAG: sigma-70 family RNA polymerase sigma factor [Deltaproteobacteria bacterium]|nr:sigma-70 family RNA polymerase sigma factor [Nannocystaceae bacterium]
MDSEARTKLEHDIRARADAGELSAAVTIALRGYGPEVLGYLVAIARNDSDAGDAFSLFCEDVWRGLPRFRWASSFRTWAYTLARHAHFRLARDPERRHPKVALGDSPELAELAVQVRTTTMMQLNSQAKSKMTLLREQLEPDDRTLLILRIDRRLSWQEIARVMADDAELADAEATRAAAALRKRFERVKDRLRKLAAEQQQQ